MCQFISGIAVKDGDSVKVYTLPENDSHEAIRAEYKIGDGTGAAATLQTPIELIPVRGLKKVGDYDFQFDNSRPSWWTDEMTAEATRQLFAVVKERLAKINETGKYGGYLYINSYAKLDALKSVGGYLSINSYAKLDAPKLESVGGYLSINSDAKLDAPKLESVGGDLSINSDAKLDALKSVGGYLSIYSGAKLDAPNLAMVNGKPYKRSAQ